MTKDLVNTRKFWQQVASEYNPEKGYNLCGSSPTFRMAWSTRSTLEELCRLRDEYLAAHDSEEFKADTVSPYSLLFIAKHNGITDKVYFEWAEKIRREFIDFCIQKFTP